jgi:hypothetical protein
MSDTGDNIKVTAIEIRNSDDEIIDDINDSYWEEKKVTLEASTSFESYTYLFSVAIMPENASNLSLFYNVIVGKGYTQLTQLKQEGNVYYFKIVFTKQDICKIEFSSNSIDSTKQTEYLYFVWEGAQNGDEI